LDTVDRIMEWSTRWAMPFNVSKCHIMHVGRDNPRWNYTMDGQALHTSTAKRDVGVVVNSNLKQEAQVRRSTATATAVLSQILKSFHYRDRHVYKRLYTTNVRPHLEFAVQAWAPWTVADTTALEAVQQKAVRAISGLKGRTYEEN